MDDKKAALREDGYVLLEGLIGAQECAHYKGLLERAHGAYAADYVTNRTKAEHALADKSGEKAVFNLHNKDMSFFRLFQNPVLLELAGAILQEGSYMGAEPFYMLSSTARSPNTGEPQQQLHVDSSYPGPPFALSAVALIMLDDFTEENGATRVIPGSHRRTSYPQNGVTYDDEIRAVAPAGSALLFNASLWHGGGANRATGTRWAVIVTYGRWWIRPSFDYAQNTPPEIWEAMDDAQKDLLGFRFLPPSDEFTRVRRRSETFAEPSRYALPATRS